MAKSNLLLKLSKQFTSGAAPLVGSTVSVTVAGSNSPAALFGSSNSDGKRLETNKLVTDATGAVSAYVMPGTYTLSLLSPNGVVLLKEDVVARADSVRSNEVPTAGNFSPVVFAATVTPVIGGDMTVVKVAQLTGNITVANPAGTIADHVGKRLVLMFEQDGTGSRTVTFGAQFKAGANVGTTGRGATEFVCDGVAWLQVGAPLTFR